MKRTTFIAAMLCLLGTGLSCTHEEPSKSEEPSNNVHEWEDQTIDGDAVMGEKMAFNVGGDMSVERTAQTRTTTNINGIATFSAGDLVAVAVTRSGSSEVVKLYRVKNDGGLEYAGGDTDPFAWKSTGETVSLRAWSYGTSTNLSYTLTPPETRDYTLETDQNTNGYLELLYCKAADKSYSDGTISLNFYHQLTRVVFNVKHEKRAALAVTSVSVGNNTFPVTASFSIPTGNSNVGTWTTKSTYNTITPKTETTQTNYDKTYSAVIFPKTYAQNTKLFTLNNSEGNYVYNVSEAAGASLTAGNQYNYSITVKDVVPLLPIQYLVGTHNMQTATTMASDDWPEHSYYFHWGSNNTTMTDHIQSFYEGIKIDNQYYHLPTICEWTSVTPPYYAGNAVENFGNEGGARIGFQTNATTQTGLGETMEWGRMKDGTYAMPATKFYSEYSTHATNANYYKVVDGVTTRIAYAIRHKDKDIAGPSGYGKYTCAYRYTVTSSDASCNNKCSLRIKVHYLGASSTTTISDITNDAYWSQSGVTYYEVILPAGSRTGNYDFLDQPGSAYPPTGNTGCGYHWTSTPSPTSESSVYIMHFRMWDVMSDAGCTVGTGIAVRLFKDTE